MAHSSLRSLLILLVSLTALLFAQTTTRDLGAQAGVEGAWRTESNPPGTTWTAAFRADGSRLIGAVSSCASALEQEIEIQSGTVEKNRISFQCRSLNGARTLTFTGIVQGNEIRFSWLKTGDGANFNDRALFGDGASPEFIARRISERIDTPTARLVEAVNRIPRFPVVRFERIRNAAQTPEDWLTYSGNLQGHRYSPLTQITKTNVKTLELAWLSQAPTDGELQATPLVVDGVMYTTRNTNDVVALDAATGREIWTFRYVPDTRARASGGIGRMNRGLAILDTTLYLATLDAHLVAIEAQSGKLIWNVTVADARDPACAKAPSCYFMTLAPLVVKDKVVVGVGGGEGPTRGFIASYDGRTGKESWRFYTIPGPGEPGHDTWSGDSWRTGGAPVWNTGAYDPDLNLTYWGVGNPYPPYQPDVRKGDNLYSNSVVALDADTGKLRWHFQFTPHDMADWDSTQVPVLVDLRWQGRDRRVMLWANRNGLMYVLDRTTGEFLLGRPFVEVNWTSGFDPKGRPILIDLPLEALVRPGSATNWQPHSYSPRTGLFYVTAWERAGHRAGKAFSAVRAFDPRTGDKKWEFRKDDTTFPRGVLTTASDLVFTGAAADSLSAPADSAHANRFLYALDATSGTELWKFALTGAIQSPPITYAVRGRQYVAVSARDTLFAFALRQ